MKEEWWKICLNFSILRQDTIHSKFIREAEKLLMDILFRSIKG